MASVSSAPPSEADSVGPSGVAPPHHEIIFPPDAAALQAIALQCGRGLCPFSIGRNVSVELFNQWLADSEDGLRVDYDELNQQVIIREACIESHGAARLVIGNLLHSLYQPYGYTAVLGQITTAAGRPNLSPDAYVLCVLPGRVKYQVIALEACLPY